MTKVSDSISYYKDLFRKEILPEIMKVVSGEKEEVSSHLHFPIYSMSQVLEKEGFEILNFESNGYQYDHSSDIQYKDQVYVLSGSGYYGATRFYKK